MGTNLSENRHVVVGDHFVSAKVSQIVEAIHEYEPNIEVQFIPETARNVPGQRVLPAFKLVYHDPNGPDMILFHVEDESKFDIRVLQRIIMNDMRHKDSTKLKTDYEAWEESQRLIERQKHLDLIEEAADIAAHVLKSPLNDYRVNKDLRIKEGIPYNVAHIKD